jgi:hypothetical protein
MTAPQPPRSSDITPRATDLQLSRVAAAALAAVTTAVLGSRLGAEGTLIGAAGASVITTVATSLYQASLERSRERVRSLAHRTRPAHPASLATLSAEDSPPAGDQLRGNAKQPSNRSGRSAAWRWAGVVVAALGGFALAMMVITGFEWASGKTVGGNGKGTTIGQVVNDQSGPRQPTAPPAATTSETPTEKPTETSEPPTTITTAPSDGGSVEQSPAKTTTPSESPQPPLIPPLPRIGG